MIFCLKNRKTNLLNKTEATWRSLIGRYGFGIKNKKQPLDQDPTAEIKWPASGGAACRNPSPRGGAGPARRVPACPRGEGGRRAHHGVQGTEASTVARATASWGFGAARMPRRSWRWRRPSDVEDVRVVSLRKMSRGHI